MVPSKNGSKVERSLVVICYRAGKETGIIVVADNVNHLPESQLVWPLSVLNFCLEDLSIGESRVLMAPIMVLELICCFMSCSICFMKLDALEFGEYV